ncbi:MAG: alpha/beta hydrolase [Hyphomicrobiales bacterium]|nr:alpha/beta hydrolase [Hyphomicrobiales bacterium]
MTKLILGILAAYAGIVALAYTMQTHMLFPARLASAGDPGALDSATPLEVSAPENVRLVGMRILPINGSDTGAPIILGFGGNAWNAATAAAYLHGLFPDNEVIVFHYRGYGPSTGQPSAAGLLSDSLLIFDHIQELLGSRNIVAVGFSIGSGVAAHLASRRPLAGLILVSPFDSLKALASQHYPWLPVRWLLRHKMDTAKSIPGVTAPTAVIAAEHDTVVSSRRTQVVRQAIPNLVLDLTIMGAGHNDLYDRAEFRSAMVKALEQIELATELR